nr:hypothetical protein [Tanacetum cinerariifolium]
MTTLNVTSSTDSQMHNNIMAAGSRDRPSMLATRRYPQWRSRFLRYIDTRPNGEALRKCILSGPYKSITILVQAVDAIDDSPAIPKHTIVETLMNIFYKLMNEMIRNNLTVAMMQVNVQFLQQLQPEWSRVVTNVKQQHKLDEVSYHKLFDILKQYQKEVNELRAKRLARNANPLALVFTAQSNQDPYYQTSRKPKKVKDSVYHKEKMLLCKQAEQGVPLQAKQYDWLADMDEEINERELEAYYSYMAKIQEQSESVSNTCLVETNDSNAIPDSPDMYEDDIQNEQNDVESDDEHVALANSIANLKLDVDENKKIQKQLKKANTTLSQELKVCKAILAETSKSLGESISVRDSCLVVLQNKQTEFEKYKAFNDRSIDYDKLERKLNEALG